MNFERMYTIKLSTKYRKDFKKFDKDINVLKELYFIIKELQNWNILPEKYKDHKLKWKFSNYRECHILPDLLLVYEINKGELNLYLLRLWTHSEIF